MKKYLPLVAVLFSLILLTTFAITITGGARNKLSANIMSLITGRDLASADPTQTTLPGAVSSSDDSASSTTSTLTNALVELQNKIQFLDDRVVQLEIARLKMLFTRTLKRGDSGKDVSALQEILAEIPEIYPTGTNLSDTATGYYGALTESAIKQFQEQNSLKKTGVFDAPTREKIYDVVGSFVASENSSSTKSDLSIIARLPNLTDTQNQISKLSSDSSNMQAEIDDIQNQIAQIFSRLSDTETNVGNLQNQIVQLNPPTTPSQIDFSSTPPITLAISDVQTTNITKNSATITWITNISASGEVDYSTNPSILINQVLIAKNTSLITGHSLTLQNLSSHTKYYYRIISKDILQDVASTTILSFTTTD